VGLVTYRAIIPKFVCFASPSPALQAHLLDQPNVAVRILSAHTAADAIAQAELELRLYPPLKLFKVEPFDEERHTQKKISQLLGPATETWVW